MTQTPKQVTANELTQDNNQSGEGKWSSGEQEVRTNMLHAFMYAFMHVLTSIYRYDL